MRPLSLEVEGFTAFRDPQTIDFRELELFAITGPTGAGKTSILDAIAFALYGQVPRLGGKQGTADLVSLGTTQARVKFEFSIKGKGSYRVARRLKRHAAQSATVERLHEEEWVSACERDGVRECERVLGEVLGLDFDSFCKAVVLPQGEFHRFLKGDTAERRKVLVSLLGVSYFERMGAIGRTRQSDLASKVERTEEIVLDQYGSAIPERLAEMRAASVAAAERSSRLTTALAESERHQSEAIALRGHAEALGEQARALQQLTTESRETGAACEGAETAAGEARSILEDSSAEVKGAQRQLDEAEGSLRTVEAQSGTIEELAKAALAAETLASAGAEETTAEAKLTAATEAHSAAERELADAEKDEAEHEPIVAERVAGESARSEALEKAKEQARTLEKLGEELRNAGEQLQSAQEQRRASETAVQSARTHATELDEALKQAIAHREEHRRANAVAELADGLYVSDPCPVCGVALTSVPVIASDVEQTLRVAHESEQEARTAADGARGALARAEASDEVAVRAADESERRYAAALGGRADPRALEDELAAATAAVDQAGEALTEAAEGRAVAERAATQARERTLTARSAREGKAELRDQAAAALKDVRTRRQGASEILEGRFGGPPPSEAEERIAGDRDRLIAAGEGATLARSKLESAGQARESANEKVRAAEKQLGTLDSGLTRLRTLAETTAASLASKLTGSEPPAVPAANANRNTDAGELASWSEAARSTALSAQELAEQERRSCEAQIMKISAEHEGAASDADRAVTELRASERSARDVVSNAESAEGETKRRLAERVDMEATIKQEKAQIAVLAELVAELRGDRFGDYIVTETLQLLAAHASQELLRISDGRYSLVSEDGDFEVVDHANADERRSVKTLSGGETFLASLALALALSRHVGDLASDGLGAKLEAVFIDEGFGTLDPETLDEVIDALERLRAEDLMVGVISHVPELGERVRSGLEVHKQQGRSTIVRSA